jgi:hypothetical protein
VYGAITSRIVVPGTGISSCSSRGYAQVSALGYASNPHPNSKAVKSPLLQFGAATSVRTLKIKKAVLADGRNLGTSTPSPSSKATTTVVQTYAYYIILQYSAKQHFNLSIQASPYSKHHNVTLPVCSIYDSATLKYKSCGNCSISSYTNYNATFGCRNIRELCPQASSSRRLEGSDDQYTEEDEEEEEEEEEEDDDEIYRQFETGNEERMRRLSEADPLKDDDYTPSADDGVPLGDDEFSTKESVSSSDFGSIFAAIGAELASVLSSNPFAADLSKAVGTLAFVGGLAATIIIGLFYFLKWDKTERHQAVYMLDDRRKYNISMISDDLRKGGNGNSVKNMRTFGSIKEGKLLSRMNTVISNMSAFNMGSESSLQDTIPKVYPGSDVSQYSADTSDASENKLAANSTPIAMIVDFSNRMLPRQYTGVMEDGEELDSRNSKMLSDTFYTLKRTHWICHMFYGTCLAESRTLRFLEACRVVLLGLFIDTVIFGVFFPSDGSCGEFTKKKECLAIPSQLIAGATMCAWDGAACATSPKPSSITFTLLLAFVIMIFIVPLDYGVGYFQEAYASKRPNLEKWGVSSNSWLGSVHHGRESDVSPLETAFAPKEGERSEDGSLDTVEKTVRLNDRRTEKVFIGLASPREELNALLARLEIASAAEASLVTGDYWASGLQSDTSATGNTENLKETRKQLMVNCDGTLQPLTIRQRLSYSSRQALLEKKLTVARAKAVKICEELEELEGPHRQFRDIALMRHFILEQVTVFNRFSLRRRFEKIDGAPAEGVHPLPWLLSWFLIGGCLLFFLYWIFAWGVKNGAESFGDWGKDYGVGVIQDVVVCETAKLCIVFIFAVLSAKPQLQVIKRVISDCALSVVQDNGNPYHATSAVHHFSATCRAANTPELYDLPSAAILRYPTSLPAPLTSHYIVLHMSGSPLIHPPFSMPLTLQSQYPSHHTGI